MFNSGWLDFFLLFCKIPYPHLLGFVVELFYLFNQTVFISLTELHCSHLGSLLELCDCSFFAFCVFLLEALDEGTASLVCALQGCFNSLLYLKPLHTLHHKTVYMYRTRRFLVGSISYLTSLINEEPWTANFYSSYTFLRILLSFTLVLNS